MEKIKIFIVDDSFVARNMLSRLLSEQSDLEVVGEAGSSESCIFLLDEVAPDMVIIEASISGNLSLVSVISEIKKLQPLVKVIVCTDPGHLDDEQIVKITAAGAEDFISKPYRQTMILRTIRTVAALPSDN